MKALKKFIACFILSMAAYYYNYLKSVAIARVSLSILTLSITEAFCLFWSNNQQQIYSGTYTSRLSLQQQVVDCGKGIRWLEVSGR